MRTIAPLACLLASLTAGCAVEQIPIEGDSSDEESGALGDVRRVLLCQQGLSDRTMEWDKGLFDLCEAAEAEGFDLIWDGDYPAFGALDENGAYKALFNKLDENDDGVVNGADSPALVHLVGFSWGGINVTDLAKRLSKDSRIATGRRGVAGMVLLDAFQPQAWHATIPANVVDAWVYRQTDTTSGDCSSTVSLGFGFNGKSPVAKSEMTSCTDYDLDAFLDGVGHCDVPKTATEAALVNLLEHEDYEPWADYASACEVD
ncbi:MAG: hypothetical protein HOV80_05340 [Polyangiaceae bacterium]|nr:hypothetical protein [Polyangiaceae bacterium]